VNFPRLDELRAGWASGRSVAGDRRGASDLVTLVIAGAPGFG
jgi:hypothetical protein